MKTDRNWRKFEMGEYADMNFRDKLNRVYDDVEGEEEGTSKFQIIMIN